MLLSDDVIIKNNCCNVFDWSNITGITLTLKQSICINNIYENGDIIKYNKNFVYFTMFLNQKLFKNGFKRYNKRIRMIAVIEKNKNGRYHIHCAVENSVSNRMDNTVFNDYIEHCWKKTKWGHHNILINNNCDQGWIDYMLKKKDKNGLENWTDCIIWDCYNN